MLKKNNFSLKEYNTFGFDVKASELIIAESTEDLSELFVKDAFKKPPLLVLGGGSNILLTKNFEGTSILINIKGIELIDETDEFVVLKIGAGENWSDIVNYTVEKNWWGIENLSLIPGTMGAAPIQNIGAYGVELKDVLVSLTAFNLIDGKEELFENKQCEFGYRTSIFKTSLKGKYIITHVSLKLSKIPWPKLTYKPLKQAFQGKGKNAMTINMISEAVKSIRRSKLPDPDELGNAGSFFKNPVVDFGRVKKLVSVFPEMPFYKIDDQNYKLAAGWLIEKAGWKGKRIDDAGVHKDQALVLVNYGKASGKDIVSLSMKIQKSVAEMFEVELVPEVTII